MSIILASYLDAAVRPWDARNGTLVPTLTRSASLAPSLYSSAVEDNQVNDISVESFNTTHGGGGSAVIMTANDDEDTEEYNVDIQCRH